jgi:pimeloyl-ACP methyl ester carboxylesterase
MQLRVNNTILNVLEAGVENYNKSRPSLVFLHYFGGSSQAWTEVIDQLAADYHCVAPDLQGFGASGEKDESYDFDCYIDDAPALISSLRLEHFVLVGHSMGGKIALALAARQPAGLQSLVLLAASPPTPEPMPETERERLLTGYGKLSVAKTTVRKTIAETLPKEIFERAVNDNLRSSEPAWRAWLEAGSREDISAAVEQINIPVLVAAGEKDETITAELLEREIVSKIKTASLVVVPAVKHLLPLEAPQAVADIIDEQCRLISA